MPGRATPGPAMEWPHSPRASSAGRTPYRASSRPSTSSPAGRRDEEAFGQELTNQTKPPRAKRGTHRDLLTSSIEPSEEESRQIPAGDDEHQQHCREKQRIRPRIRLHVRIPKGRDPGLPWLVRIPAVGIRLLPVERVEDDLDLRAEHLDRRARLEARIRVEFIAFARLVDSRWN